MTLRMRAEQGQSWLDSVVKTFDAKLLAWVEKLMEEGNLFPFTIHFRSAILLFVFLRLLYFWNDYNEPHRNVWIMAIVLFMLYVVILGIVQFSESRSVNSLFNHAVQIVVDSLFFTVFYLLTGNSESGLFLFLLLPLLVVARYFPVPYTVLLIFTYLIGLALIQGVYHFMGMIPSLIVGAQEVVSYAIIFAAVAAPLTRSEKFRRDSRQRQHLAQELIELIAREAPRIAESQDPQALVTRMVGAVKNSFHVETVALFLKKKDGFFHRENMAGVRDGWLGQECYAPDEGLTGRAVNGRGFLSNHADMESGVKYLWQYQGVLPSGKVRHLLAVPLRSPGVNNGSEAFGILRLVNRLDAFGEISAEGFSHLDWETLNTFGAHLATAMTAAKREQENRSQVNRMRDLAALVSSLVPWDKSENLLREVVKPAARIIGVEDCSIYWVNRAEQTIDLKASNTMPSEKYRNRQVKVHDGPESGLPAFVAATGQTLCFFGDEYQQHPSWGRSRDYIDHVPSRACNSLLLHPIKELVGREADNEPKGSVLGVIEFKNKLDTTEGKETPPAFTPRDIELAAIFAAQIAATFRKIHLHGVTKSISAMRELKSVLPEVAKGATEIVPADFVVIIPYDNERGELLVDNLATYPPTEGGSHGRKPQSGGATEQILASPDGYLTVQDLDAEPNKRSRFTDDHEIHAYIGVLLKEANVPVGIMYCNFKKARPLGFAREEIIYARTFGDLAAIAIQNATLHERASAAQEKSKRYNDLARNAFLNSRAEDVDSVLRVAVDTICELIGFDFCTISLVNEFERTIVGRCGSDNAPWAEKSKHSLDSGDIQADICNRGVTEIITGWDDRFDRDIYDRYGHAELVRIFTPIQSEGISIGTVEAGYSLRRKTTIDPVEQEELRDYLEQLTYMIHGARFIEQNAQLGRMSEKFDLVDPYVEMLITKGDLDGILEFAAGKLAEISERRAAVGIRIFQKDPDAIAHCAFADPARRRLLNDMDEIAHPFSADDSNPVVVQRETDSGMQVSLACLPLFVEHPEAAVVVIAHNRFHAFPKAELDVLQFCVNVVASWIHQVQKQRQIKTEQDRMQVLELETWEVMHKFGFGTHLRTAQNQLAWLSRTKNGDLNPDQAQALLIARKNLIILSERTRNILNMRQLKRHRTALQLEPVEVGSLLSLLFEKFAREYEHDLDEKSISLSRDWHSCQNEEILVDKQRLSHTLENLLVNAVKFTPSDGIVTLRAESRGNRICISVADTGVGIDPEQRERIFEQYVRLNTGPYGVDGAGLGLFVALGFVRLHGGTIEVDGAPGEGSTFTINLPTGRGGWNGG